MTRGTTFVGKDVPARVMHLSFDSPVMQTVPISVCTELIPVVLRNYFSMTPTDTDLSLLCWFYWSTMFIFVLILHLLRYNLKSEMSNYVPPAQKKE